MRRAGALVLMFVIHDSFHAVICSSGQHQCIRSVIHVAEVEMACL
jgi:hypothetical protein